MSRSSQYQKLPDAADFWNSVASSKTDHALIYLIIKEIRQLDLSISYDENLMKMGKLKAYVDMLDLSTTAEPSATEDTDAEETLIKQMEAVGY